jgi:hypothetical protein
MSALSGAEFSQCRKFRYALWRIWDEAKPLVMFIGLNPSTANESDDDPTIKSICRISKYNGYGGVYMMNCFPYISTDPAKLAIHQCSSYNDLFIEDVATNCKDVVFAWGGFRVVKDLGIDKKLSEKFPDAKALFVNKDGSPKHPLYVKSETKLINYK